jgi:seryl-tRNA synthetase
MPSKPHRRQNESTFDSIDGSGGMAVVRADFNEAGQTNMKKEIKKRIAQLEGEGAQLVQQLQQLEQQHNAVQMQIVQNQARQDELRKLVKPAQRPAKKAE